MAIPTIRESWESFAKAVMPADAPPDQVREMRRAFYAGAHGMFHMVIELTSGSNSDQAATFHLTVLSEESDQFARDVKEGRA